MRDKIVQFIYNYLDWAYCDNCRYDNSEQNTNCEYCHRQCIDWEISKAAAEEIADGIMDIIKEVKYE